VDGIVLTVRQISGTSLQTRLPKLDTGDELQRLSDTLNDMLERIERSFLRVTRFTADASHELRTPISLMRTEAELALRKARNPQEYRESLQNILHEAERTTTLIEELLALARADSGRESLNMQELDLRCLLQSIAARWRPMAKVHDLQFHEILDEAEFVVAADETALRRLVGILLDNAMKFTPPGGSVELQLSRASERALISVRDSGVGIPAEEHENIFERFYRVDKARSRESGGAGLGLAIAQWIAQQHHTKIQVGSGVGEGATFTLQLPLLSAQPPHPRALSKVLEQK